MTIEEIKNSTKDVLTPNDVASVLHCDPNVLRLQAKNNINSLGFPISKVGTRIKIPRKAFIAWFLKGVEKNE